MKRLCLAMACMLVWICLSVPVWAAVGNSEGITAFTVTGDSRMLGKVRIEQGDTIRMLQEVLAGSQPVTGVPEGSREVARIAVEHSTGKVQEYQVLDSNQTVYLRSLNGIYKVSGQAVYTLLAQLPGLYTYSSIPTAILENGEEIPPQSSSYIFSRLDGRYYRPVITSKQAVPVVKPVDSRLPLPSITPPPDGVQVKVWQGEKVLLDQGTVADAEAFVPQSGIYQVKVTASFLQDTYQGAVTYLYDLEMSQGIAFSIKGGSTNPGELVVLRGSNIPQGQKIVVKSDIDFKPNFFNDGKGGQIALLPVSYFTAPGEHYVEMSCLGVTQRFGITAGNKQFQVQHLTVSGSTTQATIKSQEANTEFSQKFLPLRFINDEQKRWEGRFILPVQGAKITTQFGAIRYTNGSSNADRHGGVDMAAAKGTTVSASNSGRVLFAGYLKLTGNTVMIEHGYGLKTWYYHMDELSVNTGDLVSKGQKVGQVGSTGFSTGPHLHFAMSVNNVFVNPYTAMESDLLVE